MKRTEKRLAPRKIAADDAYNFAEYGIDIENRIIHIDDEITAQSTGRVIKGIQMMLVKNKEKDIDIYINSMGGDPYSGIGLYNYLRTLKSININTYNVGSAMSAASIIFLAGDKRYMYDGTVFMFHTVSSRSKGKLEPTMVDEVEECQRIFEQLCEIYAGHTTTDYKSWKKLLKFKDNYFRKDKALELGIVHKVIVDNEDKA